MKRNVKIAFIIMILLALIAFVIVIVVVVTIKKNNKRTLNYNDLYKIYSIVENKKNFELLIKTIIFCIKTPCNPPIESTIIINDIEDCDILKSLFDEIFKSNKKKEKTVNDNNLTEEQSEIILDILEKYTNYSRLDYEIIKEKDENKRYFNSTYPKRGYSYKWENETVIYTISLGEKPNSGYNIDIPKIDIYGNSAKIYIEEGSPDEDKIYPDIIVYPIIQVKFSKMPINVTVINEETGEIFPKVIIRNW